VPLCDKCHGKVHGIDNMSTSRLTKEALDRKRALGERIGEIPFGYTVAEDGRKLIEHAGEQVVIQQVLSLRDGGLSLRKIAASGVVGRTGRPLHPQQIRRILKRKGR
jgi:hypothetical protein